MDCCSVTKRRGRGNREASRDVWRVWKKGSPDNANKRPVRSVPSWEKRFCATVGLVSWRKVVEAKKYMDLYPDVVGWDDRAAKEAFKNAKKRYWARENGSRCYAELPDPDMYIDKVDWDASIDPELFLDLERAREQSLARAAEYEEAEKRLESLLVDIDPRLLANYGWDDDVGIEEKQPLMKPLWINCN